MSESRGCSYDCLQNLEVPNWHLQSVFSFKIGRGIYYSNTKENADWLIESLYQMLLNVGQNAFFHKFGLNHHP
jgi:hypothetical protein